MARRGPGDAGAAPVSTGEAAALAAIVLVSAALQLLRLDLQGIGNPYYAATVRSMLDGWHTFFFASFDPAGFVAVDKPPLGFWIQTLSARVLGYGGTALLLPQALATIGSVGLLWRLVRRPFGPAAGLFSALSLALTPIAVAAGRTNTIDPLLVLVLLAATGALFRAVERGDSRWLLVSAVLIGLGFNIKMLQSYLVVPAWGLTYLLTARAPLPRRFAHLTAAMATLLAVSFSWATVVQLTPADQRPYVGSSSTDSPFDLAFGYNGLQRLLPASLTGSDRQDDDSAPPSPGAILGAFGTVETGERSPLRLFNTSLAAQIAWLLPLALVGLAAAWWQAPTESLRRSPRRAALLFWGSWLLTGALFFSVANQFHRYYLVMLGPPLAALVGAGLVGMWHDYRRRGHRGWLLPLAIVGSSALAAAIARPFPVPGDILSPGTIGVGAFATTALVTIRLGRIGSPPSATEPGWVRLILPAAIGAAAVALLLGPAVWSGWALQAPVSNVLPAAGPGGSIFPIRSAGGGPPGMPGSSPFGGPAGDGRADASAGGAIALPPSIGGPTEHAETTPEITPPPGGAFPGLDAYAPPDPALITFLDANRTGERFVLATANSMSAAPLIIERSAPVAALGGFIGQDPILSVERLRGMIEVGEVRFFLVPDPGRVGLLTAMVGVFGSLTGEDGPRLPNFGPPTQDTAPLPGGQDPAAFLRLFLTDNVRWIAETCDPVPSERWQTPGRGAANPLTGLETLYDCGALRR